MTAQLQLNERECSTLLKVEKPFQSVKLLSAMEMRGQAIPDSSPFVELTLLGNNVKFSFHSNRIPRSTNFNCFDLLEAAKQAMGQHEQIFDRVEIQAFDKHYEAEYLIEGQIETDDKSDEK